MKVLGLGSSNPAVVDNLFFLLTFVTVAISAYVVLRWMGISIAVSVVCAIVSRMRRTTCFAARCICCSRRMRSCRSGPTSSFRY